MEAEDLSSPSATGVGLVELKDGGKREKGTKLGADIYREIAEHTVQKNLPDSQTSIDVNGRCKRRRGANSGRGLTHNPSLLPSNLGPQWPLLARASYTSHSSEDTH